MELRQFKKKKKNGIITDAMSTISLILSFLRTDIVVIKTTQKN